MFTPWQLLSCYQRLSGEHWHITRKCDPRQPLIRWTISQLMSYLITTASLALLVIATPVLKQWDPFSNPPSFEVVVFPLLKLVLCCNTPTCWSNTAVSRHVEPLYFCSAQVCCIISRHQLCSPRVLWSASEQSKSNKCHQDNLDHLSPSWQIALK